MKKSGDKVFDIRDYIAELFYAWKQIALVTILIAAVIVCFGAFRNWRQSKAESRTEQEKGQTTAVSAARAALSDSQAEEVEALYSQLLTYQDYRQLLQIEFSAQSKTYEGRDKSMPLMKSSYKVTAAVEGEESLYTEFCLSGSDCDSIQKILPDVESMADIQRYVRFETLSNSSPEIINGQDGSVEPASEYILNVYILGPDKDGCNKVWKIVDSALKKECKTLKKIDARADLEFIQKSFGYNNYAFFAAAGQTLFDNVQKADTVIINLRNNIIDKLSNEQKEYFLALRYPEINSSAKSSGGKAKSLKDCFSKKLLVLGILLGLFFTCGIKLLQYLTNSVIHVREDLELTYGLYVPAVFYSRTSKKQLFSGIIRKLRRADSASRVVKAAVAAADIDRMIRKSDIDSLYFLRTTDNKQDKLVAETIAKAVEGDTSGKCETVTGSPLGSTEEMKRFLGQDNVVLLVHARKTTRADLESILKLCGRHNINILGTVLIAEI